MIVKTTTDADGPSPRSNPYSCFFFFFFFSTEPISGKVDCRPWRKVACPGAVPYSNVPCVMGQGEKGYTHRSIKKAAYRSSKSIQSMYQ